MQRSFYSSCFALARRINLFQIFLNNLSIFSFSPQLFFVLFFFLVPLLLLRRLISFIDFFFFLLFAVRFSYQLAHSPFPLRRLKSFIASTDISLRYRSWAFSELKIIACGAIEVERDVTRHGGEHSVEQQHAQRQIGAGEGHQ